MDLRAHVVPRLRRALALKVRTKLVLLLTTSLTVTMVTATWLRIRWTLRGLENSARQQATDTALTIADDLEQHIRDDTDDDDISERLKYEQRRHQLVSTLEFTIDTDEDTTTSFNLGPTQEDTEIKRTSRPQKKPKSASQRRDDARRAFTALVDQGQSGRPPAARAVDPLWRTPDRAESSRWFSLAPRPTLPSKRASKAFTLDLRGEAQKKDRYLEVRVPVDPEGPRHGELTVRVSLKYVDDILRAEEFASVLVAGIATLVLMLLTALIVEGVVGKPVAELEQAMRDVQAGDLSRRVEVRRTDEIGLLERGFNEMLGRLDEAQKEILGFNRRLADEVRAATRDLASKNDALGQLNRLLVETRRELGDKERLAALGQLAAQLAHELGTPLGSVSGHLQLAMARRDLPPPVRDRLDVAARELDRVGKIVRDYLDSTRPVVAAPAPCDLGRLVDEAIGIAIGPRERGDVTVVADVDPQASHIETDGGLVRQILINLITNAFDATSSRDGDARIDVKVAPAQSAVAIRVGDNGVGIRPDDAARIFEPFYTTKGRGKGTGLGLAICRELATALGGRIAVESTPGSGSVFTVTLPRRARANAA